MNRRNLVFAVLAGLAGAAGMAGTAQAYDSALLTREQTDVIAHSGVGHGSVNLFDDRAVKEVQRSDATRTSEA